MNKKLMLLVCAVGLAVLSSAAETAPFGSVVGWWRFNDAANPGKDSSEYGNDLTTRGEHVSYKEKDTGYASRGCYDDSGCLYIGEKGEKASLSAKYTWDMSKGHTYLLRARNDGDTISGGSGEVANLVDKLSDKSQWHLFAERYDDKLVTGGTNKHIVWLFGDDPTSSDDLAQAVADDASKVYFPLDNSIAIGGEIGATVTFIWDVKQAIEYKGYLDDVCVVQRTMTKDEINHYYHYGDPNPYLTSGGGWSCANENLGYAAADLPGADFQVDCGRTRTISNEGGTFGGHSLILGRPADLVSVVDSSKKLTKSGNLTIKTNYAFTDLRMFAGTLTGTSGKTLTVNKLTVNATSEGPYAVAIASGTYTLSGTAVGGGWIKKTGAGTLNMTGLAGAVKVRLDAGRLKASRFDGFTGGIVLVSADAVVAFTGEGALPTEDNKLQILFDGAKPAEKTAVMTVPDGVTAAMIEDATDYGADCPGSYVTVEGGIVYVEPMEKKSVSVTQGDGDTVTATVGAGVIGEGTGKLVLCWDESDKGDNPADWAHQSVLSEAVTSAGASETISGATLGISDGAKVRAFVMTCSDETIELLDYIQSSGTQYIDTGIVGAFGDVYEAKFAFVSQSANNAYVAGESDGTYSDRGRYQVIMRQSGGKLCQIVGGTGTSGQDPAITPGYVTALGTFYTVVSDFTLGNRKLSIYDADKTSLLGGATETKVVRNELYNPNGYTIYLFAGNAKGVASYMDRGNLKLSSFKLTRGGSIVKNLVAAKSGDKVGMYDLVGGEFYENKGVSSFTYGTVSGAMQGRVVGSSAALDYKGGEDPQDPPSEAEWAGLFPANVHHICVVAPCSQQSASVYNSAKAKLEEAGYTVTLSPEVTNGDGTSEMSAAQKAKYFMQAWTNTAYDVIMAIRGGDGGAKTFAQLDPEVLRSRDVPFVGFSNVSCLLNPMEKLGVKQLISGPSLGALYQYPVPKASRDIICKLVGKEPIAKSVQLAVERAAPATVIGKPLGGHWPSICANAAADLPDCSGRIVFLEINSYTYANAVSKFDELKAKWNINSAAALVIGEVMTTTKQAEMIQHIVNGVSCPVYSGYPMGHQSGGVEFFSVDFGRYMTITPQGVISYEDADFEDPVTSPVATTEKVALGYNRLDVGVTLERAGATSVKIVLKDGQGATVATETAEFVDGAANVGFRNLAPGVSYRYDVFLMGDGREGVPAGWETLSKDLFKSVDWFGFASGAFQKATPDANILVSTEAYASKDDALGLVTPNAAPIEGERTVIEMQVDVGGAYAWNDLPSPVNNQISFGIVLKEGETADTPANRVWAYKLGSGSWTALPSSTAPVADGTYDLRAVFDYRAGHKVASCTLTAGSVDHELFSNVPLTADRMNRVGVIGGCVTCQNAAYPCITSPTEVEPKGSEIELDASGEVDLAKLTAGTAYTVRGNGYALCWTDANGRYATKSGNTLTMHEGTPANGLESFTSHALGLDPTKELDKPAAVVKEGGMQAADGVTVHVPNVVRGNLPDAGVEVLFQRQKSADGGKTWTDDGAAVSVGGDLKIPFDGNLYRVNTVLR